MLFRSVELGQKGKVKDDDEVEKTNNNKLSKEENSVREK